MDKKHIIACILTVIVTLLAVLLITDSASSSFSLHDVTILSENSTHEKSAFGKSDAPWSQDELKRKDATWNGDVKIQMKKGGVSVTAGQRENPMTAVSGTTPLLPSQEAYHGSRRGGGMMGGGGSTSFKGARQPENPITACAPKMGGFGGMMPWQRYKKTGVTEEEIIETGAINAAPATHPEEPWGTPVGDALLPLMLFAALWIYLKKRH